MLQIVQNGEKCKKPKKWDFQPKITKCAPFWAQKWGFSEKCRKSPETLRNAIIFQNIICCIMSQSMSRHLSCFLLYVVCLVLLRFWTVYIQYYILVTLVSKKVEKPIKISIGSRSFYRHFYSVSKVHLFS